MNSKFKIGSEVCVKDLLTGHIVGYGIVVAVGRDWCQIECVDYDGKVARIYGNSKLVPY